MADETTTIEDVRLRPHFSDLTTGELNGLGLFDELMQTVKQHLLEEYSTQRIKGAEYSKVYLGSMEATLQNAVQYLLGIGTLDLQLKKLEKENELLDLQKDLVEAQVKKVDADILQTEAQIALIEAQTNTEVTLLPGRTNELNRKGDLLTAQTSQSNAEKQMTDSRRTDLLPQEVAQLKAQTEKLEADTAETEYRTANILPQEKNKSVADTEVSENQASKLLEDIKLVKEQVNKIAAEVDLIAAKEDVEKKQVSVFDAQINQLQEQAAAFDKEIAVKNAKIHADAWSAKAVADGSGAGGPPSWT